MDGNITHVWICFSVAGILSHAPRTDDDDDDNDGDDAIAGKAHARGRGGEWDHVQKVESVLRRAIFANKTSAKCRVTYLISFIFSRVIECAELCSKMQFCPHLSITRISK